MNKNSEILSFEDITKNYYRIEHTYTYGKYWELYENKQYGDEVMAIAVNLTDNKYCFTFECLIDVIFYPENYKFYKMK